MSQKKALLGLFLFFSISLLGLAAAFVAVVAFVNSPTFTNIAIPNVQSAPMTNAEYEDLKLNCVRLHNTSEAFMSPKDKDDWSFCQKIMVFR